MWLVEQLMGKMQYLEHVNTTSGQEEINRQEENKTKRKQNVNTSSQRGCNKSNNNPKQTLQLVTMTKLGRCVINTSQNILLEYQNWQIRSAVTSLLLQ